MSEQNGLGEQQEGDAPSPPPAIPPAPESQTPTAPSFSATILNIGFVSALILAAIAFSLAGLYLLRFADSSSGVVSQVMTRAQSGQPLPRDSLELLQNALTIHAYVARVLLVSCGMFIALSFGFLGFALFLVGASGQSDATIDGQAGAKISLTNLAPGTVAIVAATILAALCVTKALPVDFKFGGRVEAPEADTPRPGDPLASADRNLPPDACDDSKAADCNTAAATNH